MQRSLIKIQISFNRNEKKESKICEKCPFKNLKKDLCKSKNKIYKNYFHQIEYGHLIPILG